MGKIMAIRIIIANNYTIVTEGIKAVLKRIAPDIITAGEASNGNQTLKLAKKSPVDVYVLDITMPSLNGIDTAIRLLRENKTAKIIFISMHNNESMIEKALQTGAKGYLLKENIVDEIAKAIYAVHRGGYYLDPSISNIMIDKLIGESKNKIKSETGRGKLTTKEREIVQLIAEGMANKEIARELKISINTVHTHRNNIANKLNIHKQTELVQYAFRENIIQL